MYFLLHYIYLVTRSTYYSADFYVASRAKIAHVTYYVNYFMLLLE